MGVCRTGETRPPSEVVVASVDQHRAAFGVQPLCGVLRDRSLDVLPSPRSQRHAWWRCVSDSARVGAKHRGCGPRKVWRQLRREGWTVAPVRRRAADACAGLRGASRGRASGSPGRPTGARTPVGSRRAPLHGRAAESALGGSLHLRRSGGLRRRGLGRRRLRESNVGSSVSLGSIPAKASFSRRGLASRRPPPAASRG